MNTIASSTGVTQRFIVSWLERSISSCEVKGDQCDCNGVAPLKSYEHQATLQAKIL